MTLLAGSDEEALGELVADIFSRVGHRPDAGRERSLRGAIRKLTSRGVSTREILARVLDGDPSLVGCLLAPMSIPETYFFRTPDHFEWIATAFLPNRNPRAPLRAWSAGCATGEEAYSMAACLLAEMGSRGEGEVGVLGTDVLESHVQVANAAFYGGWSHRPSGPMLYPLSQPALGGVRVKDAVRAITRFETHNLLDPPPRGSESFDLILCRNVLIYFAADALRIATAHLASALAPGGALIFGPLDVNGPPRGLVRVGRPELNIFTRPPIASLVPVPKRASSAPPRVQAHIARHLCALECLDRGDKQSADEKLSELRQIAPDYVPGLLEYALLHVRRGDTRTASEAMRALAKKIESRPVDECVLGPEDLPIGYYLAAARAFLDSGR